MTDTSISSILNRLDLLEARVAELEGRQTPQQWWDSQASVSVPKEILCSLPDPPPVMYCASVGELRDDVRNAVLGPVESVPWEEDEGKDGAE